MRTCWGSKSLPLAELVLGKTLGGLGGALTGVVRGANGFVTAGEVIEIHTRDLEGLLSLRTLGQFVLQKRNEVVEQARIDYQDSL